MQRRRAGRGQRVDVGVRGHEQANDRRVTALRRDVQRRIAADARRRRGARARREQRRDRRRITAFGRLVQRRHAVALRERRGGEHQRQHERRAGDRDGSGDSTCRSSASPSVVERAFQARRQRRPGKGRPTKRHAIPTRIRPSNRRTAAMLGQSHLVHQRQHHVRHRRARRGSHDARCPAADRCAPPSTTSGQRLWLWTLPSPIGDP